MVYKPSRCNLGIGTYMCIWYEPSASSLNLEIIIIKDCTNVIEIRIKKRYTTNAIVIVPIVVSLASKDEKNLNKSNFVF